MVLALQQCEAISRELYLSADLPANLRAGLHGGPLPEGCHQARQRKNQIRNIIHYFIH
jgi:hypothetical protein